MNPTDVAHIDSARRSVLICRNPKSGASDRQAIVDRLAAALIDHGLDVQAIDSVDELCELTRQYSAAGSLRTVVAAGGDGTVSMLVNILPASVPLTVFPLGTANLLARYLGASADIEKTAKTIVDGRTVLLDAGKANDRLFLVVASCGFDADVVDRIHATRKGHITYLSYGLPIIRSICKYRFPRMEFSADGETLDPARWAFVFNLPQYAMDLRLIEEADGQDGQLDLCTFRDGGFLNGLGYFFAVLFRRHRKMAAASFTQFHQLRIEANSHVPFELDGDPGGYLPVEISVLPARVRFLVSDEWTNKP